MVYLLLFLINFVLSIINISLGNYLIAALNILTAIYIGVVASLPLNG